MPPSLPSFLRRRLRLHEARRSLLSGAPLEALDLLGDPCLEQSEEADRLRERVVDVVCREAGRAAEQGKVADAERLLERVEREDPERARHWRRRIDGESGPASQVVEDGGLNAERESGMLAAMGDLLAEMRRDASGVHNSISATNPGSPQAASPAPMPASTPQSDPGHIPRPNGRRPLRFHLAVDDAGEFIAIGGDEVVIGHRSAECADLPILADLEPVQARILRSESFHGGPAWMIQPAQHRTITVDGREVPEGGAPLADDQLVQLSPRVSFRFRLPDAGSCSALIEFLHGIECEGAARVLLFAQGPAGRVRAGGRPDRHLLARGLEHEINLELAGSELRISSAAELRRRGDEGTTSDLQIEVPPPFPLDITVGTRVSGRPPFGISLRAATVEGSGEWRLS